MEDFLATLSSPWALPAVIVLSILSSYFLWLGIKQGHVPQILFGLGTLIPTFAIFSWKAWALGAAACAVGFWVQSRLDF